MPQLLAARPTEVALAGMGLDPAASSARRAAVRADLGVVGAGAAAARSVVPPGFSGASMEERALRRRGSVGVGAGTGSGTAAAAREARRRVRIGA